MTETSTVGTFRKMCVFPLQKFGTKKSSQHTVKKHFSNIQLEIKFRCGQFQTSYNGQHRWGICHTCEFTDHFLSSETLIEFAVFRKKNTKLILCQIIIRDNTKFLGFFRAFQVPRGGGETGFCSWILGYNLGKHNSWKIWLLTQHSNKEIALIESPSKCNNNVKSARN